MCVDLPLEVVPSLPKRHLQTRACSEPPACRVGCIDHVHAAVVTVVMQSPHKPMSRRATCVLRVHQNPKTRASSPESLVSRGSCALACGEAHRACLPTWRRIVDRGEHRYSLYLHNPLQLARRPESSETCIDLTYARAEPLVLARPCAIHTPRPRPRSCPGLSYCWTQGAGHGGDETSVGQQPHCDG